MCEGLPRERRAFVSYMHSFFRTNFVQKINLMANQFLQHRQAAIDWLKSDRNFSRGIQVLEVSQFRPGVVAKLKRDGEHGRDAAARLLHLMRMLIQAWAMPGEVANQDLDDNGAPVADNQEQHDDNAALKILDAAALIRSGDESRYPANITDLIRTYSDAYKHRDITHRRMTELPDDNEPKTVAMRKELSDEIAMATNTMEVLYPYYERYTRDGQDLTEDDLAKIKEQIEAIEQADNDEDKDDAQADLANLSKEELQKLRKSVATKIIRAKNQLEYQQETKADAPNPMPDSPKRAKFEAKIARLTPELERIDYAIAALA